MKRILTGDRPTGALHLGHYVGSVKNRLKLQKTYECYFIIADLHVLTTRREKEQILRMRTDIHEMVLDYLACGIDPSLSTIYLQSACPAIYELNLLFEMFVSFNRLTGIPSLKEMARGAKMDEEAIPFGLVGYPVLQAADIASARAHLVPVGKDNESHIEVARLIVRRFNQLYGEVFPEMEYLAAEVPSLIGTCGQAKMSKSLGNAILLSDPSESVAKKVRSMYTDPNRISADVPGTVEGNPVFVYHDTFNSDTALVESLKARYREGKVGDVEVKEELTKAIQSFLAPIQERRRHFEAESGYVEQVIYEGTQKMIEVSNATLKEAKSAMGLSGTWNKISRVARERRGL